MDVSIGVRDPFRIEALQRVGFRVTATAHISLIGMFSSHLCLFVLSVAPAGFAEASEEATLPVHGWVRRVDRKYFCLA